MRLLCSNGGFRLCRHFMMVFRCRQAAPQPWTAQSMIDAKTSADHERMEPACAPQGRQLCFCQSGKGCHLVVVSSAHLMVADGARRDHHGR
jgi:hypothetical protein